MKKTLLIILSLYVLAGHSALFAASDPIEVIYEINVKNYQDDLFHVTVYTEGLKEENNIYNLPATVPGTYSNLNFGRFVQDFKAYDKNGNEIKAEKISTNQWKIENANNVAMLKYKVEDTFDTEIPDQKVIPMAGTGINDDFIVLNTFAVLGYFEGLQTIPVKVKIDYRSDWTLGTSLTYDGSGYYIAESYDQLADSPILMGLLSTASTTVNDINVGVYVYAPDTSINAKKIMKVADEVLQSSAEFIGYSPVTNYNFLMCFLDQQSFMANGFMGAGALEHSYSSLFVYPAFGNYAAGVKDDMAHEFLHILTPLNLHSEIIEPFNFVVPTASEHIWLYEGVTEWGSDIMQMRSGLISVDEYFKKLSDKITISDGFRNDISLTELSESVYNEAITMEFINFYNKGAVTATLLDIRLLELSDGERGLREVFLELLERYGKYKSFSEDEFFEIFVESTYPEIEDFINNYIKGTKPLPYKEYVAMLGYNYIAERISEDKRPQLGLQIGMNDKQELVLAGVTDDMRKAGLQKGDAIYKILGEEVTIQSANTILPKISSLSVGDSVEIFVKRDGVEIPAKLTMKQRMDRHIFEEMSDLTEDQKNLRDAWTKNL